MNLFTPFTVFCLTNPHDTFTQALCDCSYGMCLFILVSIL